MTHGTYSCWERDRVLTQLLNHDLLSVHDLNTLCLRFVIEFFTIQ